jgi:hypothetical protein
MPGTSILCACGCALTCVVCSARSFGSVCVSWWTLLSSACSPYRHSSIRPLHTGHFGPMLAARLSLRLQAPARPHSAASILVPVQLPHRLSKVCYKRWTSHVASVVAKRRLSTASSPMSERGQIRPSEHSSVASRPRFGTREQHLSGGSRQRSPGGSAVGSQQGGFLERPRLCCCRA